LNKKYTVLFLMFVLLFCAVLSQGQPANDSSTMENNANESALLNETAANATPASTLPNLNYIWSLTGIEAGPITMALNQEGNELYGQAAYEPEGGKAWNADVVGSVTENRVDLTLTAQKDKESITTRMNGTITDETITGDFTQISGGKKIGSGNFSATWISPDVSSFAPAIIEEPKVETPAPATVVSTAASNTSAETVKPASRFVDIHEYADKIQTGVGDISGIPI